MVLNEDQINKINKLMPTLWRESKNLSNEDAQNLIDTLEYFRKAVWFINESSDYNEMHRIALETLTSN